MITVSLKDLYDNGIVVEDDVDPGVFDSYVLSDGYAMQGELEPNYYVDFTCIQRVLDEPGKEEHLILIDAHGNSTDMGSDKITIRLYKEVSLDELCM